MRHLSQMSCQEQKPKKVAGTFAGKVPATSFGSRQRTAPVVFCRLFVPTAGMPPLVV
jgi:hypothetical protein